jgi:alpha-D-ribose 1-methylphosphonate 5-triphosphate synthase subunit PhnH
VTLHDDLFPRSSSADALAFRLQHDFRVLLDAMARPGELGELGAHVRDLSSDARELGLLPATVALCDVLLDAQTTLSVAGAHGEAQARSLGFRTHAAVRPSDAASFCVVPLDVEAQEIRRTVALLTPGTLESPHLGATCIVECATILGRDRAGQLAGSASGSAPTGAWRLSGPGIKGDGIVRCDRSAAIDARIERADEFPCGIDLVLVDGAGHVVCVPRSTHLEPVDVMREVHA